MKSFLFICFGFFCIILQTNLFLHHLLFPLKPDLTIPLTVYIGFSRSSAAGGVYVLGIGYLMDVFSGSIMGFYVFIREFMFLLIQIFKKNFFLENMFLRATVIFLFFLLESLLFCLICRVEGKELIEIDHFLRAGAFQGILSLLLWLLIFPGLFKLETVVTNFK